MIICQDRKIQKGIYGEAALLRWFQENKIGFIPISQTPHTFALAFTNTIKRPDFLVLLPSIGLIAVDAKNYTCNRGCFTISEEELNKALRFEMVTKVPFWFAYLHEDADRAGWCWISVLKMTQLGLQRKNKATGTLFRAIDLGHFVFVTNACNFGRIFSCHGEVGC